MGKKQKEPKKKEPKQVVVKEVVKPEPRTVVFERMYWDNVAKKAVWAIDEVIPAARSRRQQMLDKPVRSPRCRYRTYTKAKLAKAQDFSQRCFRLNCYTECGSYFMSSIRGDKKEE